MVFDAGGELLDVRFICIVKRPRQVNHGIVGSLGGDEMTYFGETLIEPSVTDANLLHGTVDSIEQVTR